MEVPKEATEELSHRKKNDHSVYGVNGVGGDKCDNDVNIVTV